MSRYASVEACSPVHACPQRDVSVSPGGACGADGRLNASGLPPSRDLGRLGFYRHRYGAYIGRSTKREPAPAAALSCPSLRLPPQHIRAVLSLVCCAPRKPRQSYTRWARWHCTVGKHGFTDALAEGRSCHALCVVGSQRLLTVAAAESAGSCRHCRRVFVRRRTERRE